MPNSQCSSRDAANGTQSERAAVLPGSISFKRSLPWCIARNLRSWLVAGLFVPETKRPASLAQSVESDRCLFYLRCGLAERTQRLLFAHPPPTTAHVPARTAAAPAWSACSCPCRNGLPRRLPDPSRLPKRMSEPGLFQIIESAGGGKSMIGLSWINALTFRMPVQAVARAGRAACRASTTSCLR